ncbi:CHAT domain-containing protein [Xylariaceae sp. AK1471]|nr:CHAT domain-containing protein [Xylariaceae sp. AK1471]
MSAPLDEVIQGAKETIATLPVGFPAKPSPSSDLSVLEEAISAAKEALALTGESDPGRELRLRNLGSLLGSKYGIMGAIDDLERAVDLAHSGSPDNFKRLSNLGILLAQRYVETGEADAFFQARQILEEAVAITAENNPSRGIRLHNLAGLFTDRYNKTSSTVDFENAIHFERQAVKATPENHPDLAIRWNQLAAKLELRYRETESRSEIEEAISLFESSLRHSNSPIVEQIVAGVGILRYSVNVTNWQKLFESAETAVNLIPKLASRSLENSDKQYFLSEVSGLASDAAVVALNLGKEPRIALNILELGRGVLAGSLAELRTDVLDLCQMFPQMGNEFLRIRDELDAPVDVNPDPSDQVDGGFSNTRSTRRYNNSQKFDQLVSDIREKAGFEDFLLPPTEERILSAAACGPIIVVNVSRYRCDAILVERRGIQTLRLPQLHLEDIIKMSKSTNLGSSKVLGWLWDTIAEPVLDILTLIQPPANNEWPHIWWIPTGPLTKFPLHAAGHHKSRESVLDRAMSSYSANIKATIHGRELRKNAPTRLSPDTALLVAMSNTPRRNSLPIVDKECDIVRRICKSMAMKVEEPERRKKQVLAQLPRCTIFHFAGHGHTHYADPAQSYLLLSDWEVDRLTVANLLETNLRENYPFLAYLSACSTGITKDERFADESIHLISACQLAGYRHVIGTLWEVNDETCVEISRITYESLKHGGLMDHTVCLGLHEAIRHN